MGNIKCLEGSGEAAGTGFFAQSQPIVGQNTPYVFTFVRKNIPLVGFKLLKAFTLVELLVTLAIAVILALVVGPNIGSFLRANQLTSVTNDFIHDISLARSEASKQGLSVGICPSLDGGKSCGGTNWNTGWLVFSDVDGGGSWNGSDTVIRFHGTSGSDIAVTGSSSLILYNRQGYAANGDYQFCSPSLKKSRIVRINATGQHRIAEGTC